MRVRIADGQDVDALIELSRQEQDFHARHTRTGTVLDQSPAATRRTVLSWLAADASAPTLVAQEPASGAVLGCSALMVLAAPPDTARALYLPDPHGYIGLTCVDQSARGRGVGRALTAAALRLFADRGIEAVLLHYIDDNPLSRPFWNRMGFAPVVEILRGAPAGAGSSATGSR